MENSLDPSRSTVRPPILAFSGRAASGKSTICLLVSCKTGWLRVSFGEYLRAEASRQGLDSTRETLQHLGADLAARDLETFIRTVLYSCGWSRGLPAVVDSIRYFSALDILRRMAYPAELLLVFVDLDDETRLERMKARGECADSVELSIIDSRPTEIGWAELRQAADLVVDGRRSPEDNATQIVRWIRALGG